MTVQEYAQLYRNVSAGENVVVGDIVAVQTSDPREEAYEFTVMPEDSPAVNVVVRGFTSTAPVVDVQSEEIHVG